MPDVPKFFKEMLVQVIPVAGAGHEKSEQGIFGRKIPGVMGFFRGYTHSVSISAILVTHKPADIISTASCIVADRFLKVVMLHT